MSLKWAVRLGLTVLLIVGWIYQDTTGEHLFSLIFGSLNPPRVWKPLDPAAFPGQEATFQQAVSAYNDQDFDTAAAIWRQLGEAGNAEAQYRLGDFLDAEWSPMQDEAEATQWFQRAADQEHPEALAAMARRYMRGLQVPKDRARATRLYKRSMDLGSAWGTFGFARSVYYGYGVREDQFAAYELYKAAASAGYCLAHQNLGDIYVWGIHGVDRDSEEAYRQFWFARKRGCPTEYGEFLTNFLLTFQARSSLNEQLNQDFQSMD